MRDSPLKKKEKSHRWGKGKRVGSDGNASGQRAVPGGRDASEGWSGGREGHRSAHRLHAGNEPLVDRLAVTFVKGVASSLLRVLLFLEDRGNADEPGVPSRETGLRATSSERETGKRGSRGSGFFNDEPLGQGRTEPEAAGARVAAEPFPRACRVAWESGPKKSALTTNTMSCISSWWTSFVRPFFHGAVASAAGGWPSLHAPKNADGGQKRLLRTVRWHPVEICPDSPSPRCHLLGSGKARPLGSDLCKEDVGSASLDPRNGFQALAWGLRTGFHSSDEDAHQKGEW